MKIRLILMAFLLVAVMIFAVQNSATVALRFLWWEIDLPRSLMMFMMLFIGAVFGWSSRIVFRSAARKPD